MSTHRSSGRRTPSVASSAMSSASQKKIEEAEAEAKIADMELDTFEKVDNKKEQISQLMKEVRRHEDWLKPFKNVDLEELSAERKAEYQQLREGLEEAKENIAFVKDEIEDLHRSLERKTRAVRNRVKAKLVVIDENDNYNQDNDVYSDDDADASIAAVKTNEWVSQQIVAKNSGTTPPTEAAQGQSGSDVVVKLPTPPGDTAQKEWIRKEFENGLITEKVVQIPATTSQENVQFMTQGPAPQTGMQAPVNWNQAINTAVPQYGHQEWNYPNPPRPASSVYDYSPPPFTQPLNRNSEMETKLVQLLDRQMELMSSNQVNSGTREILVKSNIDKDLPFFSGDPGQYNNFVSAYQRSTKKYKYDEDQNIMRLQKALKGDAKAKVLHLMANPMNLDKIMDTLKKTFGRPEFILDYLVEKAKACEKVQVNKPETLIAFGDAIDALLTNVCSYDRNEYMYNKQLVKELIEKLPSQLQERWFEWRAEDDARETNLRNFTSWLELNVNAARLRITPNVKMGTDQMDPQTEGRRTKRGPATVHVASTEETGKWYCFNCKQTSHSTSKCWKFGKKSIEEKWNLVKEEKLCFLCLRSGHRTAECRTGNKCSVDGCGKNHHPLLHNSERKGNWRSECESDGENKKLVPKSKVKPSRKPSTIENEEDDMEETEAATTATSIVEGTDGALPIIPVYLKGPNGAVKTYALLDTGASRSLIEQDLADELGLNGKMINFKARGFGGHLTTVDNAKSVSVEISGNYRGAKYAKMDRVVTVEKIGISPYSLNLDEAKKKWPCLRQVKGKSLKNVVPRIIVGTTHRHLTIPREILCSKMDGPVATRTLLGWVLEGDLNGNGNGTMFYLGAHIEDMNTTLHNLIKETFKVEDFGIVPSPTSHSMEDRKALQIMESSTTQRVDGVWETGLIWRDPNTKLPKSYDEAYRRLLGTERRMQRDALFQDAYMKKIEEYRSKGYIRRLDPEEVKVVIDRTFYIPHFGVTNPNKPGKFRLVFDAAAKAKGTSLNDCLLTGPDLLRPLTSVLWNFRRHEIVISGDIEDMFHRVRIRKEDQCSQRFLWRDGIQKREPDVYEMEVMIFGATSSPSSANFVKNKNAEKFRVEYPDACRAIQEDFYMDDCLSGGNSDEEVIKLREDVTFVNKQGGFVIKKWMSNSQTVMDSIPKELRLEGTRSIAESQSPEYTERVLGLWWDPKSDYFTFKCNFHKVKKEILEGKLPTKREICSLVMSLYDPLGFIGHYRVKGMMLLQRVWITGIGWDDEVDEDIFEDWKTWLSELKNITEVRVPRYYGPTDTCDVSVELHTFVDASKEAYAAVCYFRIVSSESVCLSLIGSKVKVAPLKKLTIPKLELQAAVLGAKFAASIKAELKVKVDKEYYWSDSRTVLSWIRSPSARHPEFVANRVGAIQDLTNISDWRWIPTLLNVADDATRMNTKTEFSSDSRWYAGPPFLNEDEKDWPIENSGLHEESDDEEKALGTAFRVSLSIDDGRGLKAGEHKFGDTLRASSSTDDGCGLRVGELKSLIPQFEKFSSYTKLLRVTTAVARLAKYWLAKTRKQIEAAKPPLYLKIDGVITSTATPEDLSKAEQMLIKAVQLEALTGPAMKKMNLKKLSPYFDEFGILRARGRIDRSAASGVSCRPIILPSHHRFTDLLVDREHRRNAHTGIETVLSNLRKRFWILHGRQAVRRCWTRCNHCRIQRAKPIIPEMGILPSCRLASGVHPFTYTGVDYFGPMEVTVGRRHEKRWGVLFTCMVTRAIHLEVAHGLSSDETLLALSRFVDSRRRPHTIFSDNGTNFHGAIKELERAIACEKYKQMMQEIGMQEIQWKFIPPAAAHMGGAWERLIQAVKKVMKNILHERYPKDSVLLTVMKAAENIVNSRPLTYISSDIDDAEALTPNHIIKCGVEFGPSIPSDVDSRGRYFREKWKEAQAYANLFWERWTNEFLPNLLRREKWTEQVEPIEVGDLVLILDDQMPRNCWVKAVVTDTFPGTDGQVRAVEVTTRDFSTKKKTTLKRPVTKLCPLGLKMCKSSVMTSDLGAGNVKKKRAGMK